MSTAQERLQQGYYNSAAVSGANPGGLASGGHVPNFPAALQDLGVVAQDVGAKAAATFGAAQSAGQSATAAHDDRLLAQQAAQQAAQFDPSTKATLGANVRFASVAFGVGPAFFYEVSTDGRTALRTSSSGLFVFETNGNLGAGGQFIAAGGNPCFHAGNDGSGSGLDADLVRGQVPSVGAAANSLAARNGDGSSGFKAVYLAPGGQVFFEGIQAGFYEYDASTLGFGKAIYVGQGVSASELRQRSDRRLKRDIQPLETGGRLAPVRFVLKDTGEEHIGFIAQDVAEVRREAVRVGGGEGEQPMLEVSPMALIAHLAAQVNALQDRLDAAGL